MYSDKKFIRVITWVLLLCVTDMAYAQQKMEREFTVQATAVPKAAVDFVDSLKTASRVVWFKELGLDNTTYEAKFVWKGVRYSIEFDTTGKLEDVEIDIRHKNVTDSVWLKMQATFKKDLHKHRVSKVQLQYSGPTPAVFTFLNEGNSAPNLLKQYEVEVIGTRNRKRNLYEYLFSETGEVLKRSEVVLRNTDNLEY